MDYFNWDDIELTSKKSGEIVTTCPACSSSRKKTKDKCLGVNLDLGVAHCNHCGAKSTRDFKESSNSSHKVYKEVPWSNKTELSDNVVKWFKGRGIGQSTLMECKISEGKEWMPQTQKKENTIQFPYFLGDKCINVKYRDGAKHFKLVKDARKILYGVDDLKGLKTAYFVEGEIDKLAFYEAGIKNAVSCPNGATISKTEKEGYEKTHKFDDQNILNLEYLDESMEYIDHIEKWIICTDKDAPGLKLERELIRRFGAENCETVDFKDCKDANEYLLKYGAIDLGSLKSNPVPLDGVFTIEDEWSYIKDVRDNGYKRGLPIGVDAYDKHYTYRLGEMDLISGIPNHGKTTAMGWEMVVTAVKFGWKWAVYSPENYPAGELYISIIEIFLGKDVEKKSSISATDEEMDLAKEFVAEHFFVIDWDSDDAVVTPEMIIGKTKELIKQKGINALLVDPWNDLYHEYKPGENDAKYLQRVLSQYRRFKRKYNLKVVINAHPIVSKQREKEDHPEQGSRPAVCWFYDNDGGAMWGNRMDNCRTIYRNVADDMHKATTEMHVQKIKFQKLVGQPTTDQPILMRYVNNRFLIDGYDPLGPTQIIPEAPFVKIETLPVTGQELSSFDMHKIIEEEEKSGSAPF